MKTRVIASQVAVKLFPRMYERWLAERAAKQTAMQALLDASRRMRECGMGTDSIDDRLLPALINYKFRRYEQAVEDANSPIYTCIAI